MAFCAKVVSPRISGSQVAVVRFAISLLPVLIVPRFRKAAADFHRFDLLFYRGFFGGTAVLLYFLAIQHIPVGVAALLNSTSPVFSGLFAALFIGEAIRPRAFFPLTIALVGVALVVHSHVSPQQLFGFGPWELVALGSALLSGAALTTIRVARRTEGSWAIFGSFALCGLLAALPFGIAGWKTPDDREWALLLAAAGLSVISQLLMTHAFRWVENVTAGVISQLAVVVAMGLGAAFLGETMTLGSAAGTILTLGGIAAVMIVTAKPRPSAFDEPTQS